MACFGPKRFSNSHDRLIYGNKICWNLNKIFVCKAAWCERTQLFVMFQCCVFLFLRLMYNILVISPDKKK
jgi:hypothetical protein